MSNTDRYSYWTGTIIAPELSAYLLGRDDLVEQRVDHTVVAILRHGTRSASSFPWSSIAICWAEHPVRELILIGHGGDIAAGPIGKLEIGQHIQCDREEGKYGYLCCARSIGGRVYIGGVDRQAYRRIPGGWEALDEGLPGATDDEPTFSIQALDGFSETEIYGAGRQGEIWRFDGQRWHAGPSLTNLILLGLHCADDGYVYICGQVGTLLRGRGDVWEVIENTVTKEDFWDVIKFKGVVYLATRDVLYALKDGEIAPVDFGDEGIPFSFYRFSASADELITIGAKDVMRFDGQLWSRID